MNNTNFSCYLPANICAKFKMALL